MASDYFFATLNGQSYYDLQRKVMNIDRSVTSFKDRYAQVMKLIGDNSYLVKYFSNYFDPHLTSANHLSNGNNICHLVEILSNYLLMSDEFREMDGREKTYYIDSNRLNRKKDRPGNIDEQAAKNNTMVVSFNKENYKLDKTVSIKMKDFDDSWCGRVLSDQQAGINHAAYKIHNHLGNQFRLSRMKHELHEDQLETKISLHGIFDLDSIHADSSADDYYATLSEPQTVRAMLRMPHDKAVRKSVTHFLWMDLEDLLKQVKFSKSEHFDLSLYSLGYSYRDIAKRHRHNDGSLHPVTEPRISQILSGLYRRIAKQNHINIVNNLRKRFKKEPIKE